MKGPFLAFNASIGPLIKAGWGETFRERAVKRRGGPLPEREVT